MAKLRVKKGDKVIVIAGKDKGFEGEILRCYPKLDKVVVQNVNMVKKTMKPTQKNPNGGINTKEAPIHVSNIALLCPECEKPTRVGYIIDEQGNKHRLCKKCKKTF